MPGFESDSKEKISSIDELLSNSHLFNLLDSSVAIFNHSGKLVYHNNAFARLNNTFTTLRHRRIRLLELDAVRSGISAALNEKISKEIDVSDLYENDVPINITIMLRPVYDRHSGNVDGLIMTVGEENLTFKDHQFARMQVAEQELKERVKVLSKEQLKNDALLRALLKKTPFGIMLIDENRKIIQANSACEKMLGTISRQMMGHSCEEFINCYRKYKSCPVLDRGGSLVAEETQCLAANSKKVPVLRSTVLLTHTDEPVIMESFVDITEKKQADRQMQKLSSALEQTADSVVITNAHGVIEYVNPSFEFTTGYFRHEVVGKTPRILKSGQHDEAFYKNLWGTILSGQVFSDVLINRKKNGETYYEEKTITPLFNQQNEITSFISTGKNITRRIEDEKRLTFLAHHDALTKLPNRVMLMERMEHALHHSRRRGNLMAVLFLDLDRFKSINDSLGHATGDELLVQFAVRLVSCLREDDTVARLGGDEFAILLEDIHSTEEVAMIAQKILNISAYPINIEHRDLIVTSSVGISMFPEDGDTSDMLVKNADIAMYRAKELGRNNYHFYSADMGKKVFEHLILENNLRHALERNEFMLHYQPQYDVRDNSIIGVEALLRWQHPELGLVSPANFIPVLEDTGLIVQVGGWIIDQACRAIRRIQNLAGKALNVSVNVSPRQFSDPELCSTIKTALDKHGIEAGLLTIEITESVLIEHNNTIMNNFTELDRLGVGMSLDDFGTGYSSLGYLQRFPIRSLKIDRSFIRDVTTPAENAAIVQAIIAMARSLGLQVIAEGVETEQQLDYLKKQQCHIAQGYLFSEPLTEDELLKLSLS